MKWTQCNALNTAAKQRGWDTRGPALPRTCNTYLTQATPKNTCQILQPHEIPESKISNPRKSFDHPRRLKSGTPPLRSRLSTGKNNRFPFLDILECPQKSQIWKSETSPNQGTWLGIPWLGLVSFAKFGIFMVSFKYPKISNNGNLLFFPVKVFDGLFSAPVVDRRWLPMTIYSVEVSILHNKGYEVKCKLGN